MATKVEQEVLQSESINAIPLVGTGNGHKPELNLLERAIRTTKYTPRYPQFMVGKPLLWATCFFGSLGDSLFGYDQGESYPQKAVDSIC